MALKTGEYDIPAAQYHADPCESPSLSSGVIKVLASETPAHARLCHPKLNPNYKHENKRMFDIGAACHQLILGDVDRFRILDPKRFPAKNGNIPTGYTNDAIREARDAAYDADCIPLLPWEHDSVVAMEKEVRKQLIASGVGSFSKDHGKCEHVLIWKESGVWCRLRLDWRPNDLRGGVIFDDLKSTDGSANPETWAARTMFSIGADIQAAWYLRGIRAVLGIDARFRFIPAEQNEPYCISFVEPSPRALELANLKIDAALASWADCLKTGVWPGYRQDTYLADPPAWAEVAWMNKQISAQSE